MLAVAAGLLCAAACFYVARRLISRSRSARWRSVPAAIALYVVVAVLTGLIMVLTLVDRGPTGQPAILTAVFVITRPVNILILALVVQQVRDGVATTRAVDSITRDQLLLAQRANAMIEAAEQDLRGDSLRMFASQVARPLRRIVREGPDLDDDALADAIDDFIASRLRPMAHVLHPVSVRLGLIPAMRSLNPEISVDASPTVARMDADGVLLDDDVRLQLYRWIRGGLPADGPSRAALVIRGRDLEVSLHPATSTSIDAVQATAGLRPLGPGLIAAPLRGQVVQVPVVGSRQGTPSAGRVRYRVRDLLTVPLPSRLALVAMLSLASAPYQFVLYRWAPSVETLLPTIACAITPIIMAVLLDRLPPPRQSIVGAWRVVGEWIAIAAASAFTLAAVASAFEVFPSGPAEWVLTFLRITYRYAIPGLLVTLTYGLVVESQRRLRRAEDALQHEDRRRIALLAASRQLDRDVAEALHRTVQGRLAAAVVMLRLGQRDEAWAQVIEMSTVEIPWLLERMGDAPANRLLVPDPPIGLTVVQMDDLPFDQSTFGLIARAVGEVAVNARRHGGASTLVVSAVVDKDRCQLICEDDGSGIKEPVTPGLGTRLLDDTAAAAGGAWRIERLRKGCRVVLDMPMDTTARGLASSVV
jgi:two-component sensor histidine kinase